MGFSTSALTREVLLSYPAGDRTLGHLHPVSAACRCYAKAPQTIETTDILLQMVESGRGVAALPLWLVQEYAVKLDVMPVRLGKNGIPKQIFLGARDADFSIDYVRAFI